MTTNGFFVLKQDELMQVEGGTVSELASYYAGYTVRVVVELVNITFHVLTMPIQYWIWKGSQK